MIRKVRKKRIIRKKQKQHDLHDVQKRTLYEKRGCRRHASPALVSRGGLFRKREGLL